MNNKIKILQLNKCPEHADTLAEWSYNEWYKERPITLETVKKAYRSRSKSDLLPITFTALSGRTPVGMVSLKNNDLWSRKDINPWLASLFVVPEYRNKGIGNLLISSVVTKTTELGLQKIYLFLGQHNIEHLKNYYEQKGWNFFDNAIDNDGADTKIFYYKSSD